MAQDEPPPRAKVAALLNLPPWQSWMHLFCEKSAMPACAVTLWCGKQTGEPATWDIDVDSGRVDAGKTAELTSQGNTCAAHLVIQHSPYELRYPSVKTLN